MTNFFNPITGNQINVPYGSQLPLNLTAPIQLSWPTIQADSPYPVYQTIIIATSTSAGNTITFPDATAASLNYQTVIYNYTAFTITVLKNDGVTVLVNILTGQAVNILLTDSSTANGTWITYVAGAGTSSADAAALAGYGLKAIGTTLNSNYLNAIISVNFTIQPTNRATIFEWIGGAGAVTLQAGSVYQNGFWFGFKILPTSGSVTFTPPGGTTINGATSYTLSPGNSAAFLVDFNGNWITFWDGIPSYFIPSVLNEDIGVGTTAVSLATQVQSYTVKNFTSNTGSLLAPCTITYAAPLIPSFSFLSNLTTGGQNLTITDGTNNFTITPNQTIILECDGTRLYQVSEFQNINVINTIACLDTTNKQVGFKSATTNAISSQIYTLPTNFPTPAANSLFSSSSSGTMAFIDGNLNSFAVFRRISDQTLSNTGTTNLIFDTFQFSTASGYNTSIGVFTAPTAGIYQVNVFTDFTFVCTTGGTPKIIIAISSPLSPLYNYNYTAVTTSDTRKSILLSALVQLNASANMNIVFDAQGAVFTSIQLNSGSNLSVSKYTGG